MQGGRALVEADDDVARVQVEHRAFRRAGHPGRIVGFVRGPQAVQPEHFGVAFAIDVEFQHDVHVLFRAEQLLQIDFIYAGFGAADDGQRRARHLPVFHHKALDLPVDHHFGDVYDQEGIERGIKIDPLDKFAVVRASVGHHGRGKVVPLEPADVGRVGLPLIDGLRRVVHIGAGGLEPGDLLPAAVVIKDGGHLPVVGGLPFDDQLQPHLAVVQGHPAGFGPGLQINHVAAGHAEFAHQHIRVQREFFLPHLDGSRAVGHGGQRQFKIGILVQIDVLDFALDDAPSLIVSVVAYGQRLVFGRERRIRADVAPRHGIAQKFIRDLSGVVGQGDLKGDRNRGLPVGDGQHIAADLGHGGAADKVGLFAAVLLQRGRPLVEGRGDGGAVDHFVTVGHAGDHGRLGRRIFYRKGDRDFLFLPGHRQHVVAGLGDGGAAFKGAGGASVLLQGAFAAVKFGRHDVRAQHVNAAVADSRDPEPTGAGPQKRQHRAERRGKNRQKFFTHTVPPYFPETSPLLFRFGEASDFPSFSPVQRILAAC